MTQELWSVCIVILSTESTDNFNAYTLKYNHLHTLLLSVTNR